MPIVPITNNKVVSASTAFRIRRTLADLLTLIIQPKDFRGINEGFNAGHTIDDGAHFRTGRKVSR